MKNSFGIQKEIMGRKMKKVVKLLLFVFVLTSISCNSNARADESGQSQSEKIRIIFADGEAIVSMLDNPMSREFMARLPMNIVFEDYAQTEKIFYPKDSLNTEGGMNADKVKGDFCYYAPWGNVAVFHKGFGHGTNLYVLGIIETGKKMLSDRNEPFSARIEKLK